MIWENLVENLSTTEKKRSAWDMYRPKSDKTVFLVKNHSFKINYFVSHNGISFRILIRLIFLQVSHQFQNLLRARRGCRRWLKTFRSTCAVFQMLDRYLDIFKIQANIFYFTWPLRSFWRRVVCSLLWKRESGFPELLASGEFLSALACSKSRRGKLFATALTGSQRNFLRKTNCFIMMIFLIFWEFSNICQRCLKE